MVWNWTLNRHRSFMVLLVFVLTSMVGLAGCGSQQNEPQTNPSRLTSVQLVQADRSFAKLQQESSLRHHRKVLDLAGALLDHYSSYKRNDEVLDMAVKAAANLEETQQARSYAEELFVKYPDSPLVGQNLLKCANISAASGDSLAAAGYLLHHFDLDPSQDTLPDGSYLCDPYLRALTDPELGLLMGENTEVDLWPYIGYIRIEKLMADGDFVVADQVMAELQAGASLNSWTVDARELLQGENATGGAESGRGIFKTQPDKIGVLCPLTGRFAVYGNAFFDAALLAVDSVNNETGRSFELKVEDTANDPVSAALAARKLCVQEGSIALLGALRSSPTSCAAIISDQYGIPLISPTAENHHIWELGEGVFQTNLTDLYEIRLLAQMACTVMLKQRYAILYPNDEKGRGVNQARLFQAEVEKFGGSVVAVVGYSTGSSDFRKEIMEIRQLRPEVIFAPATVDQMAQLAPQLDFHHSGAVILGLSNLNSDKILKRAGSVLERTIFPSDVAVFPGYWVNDFRSQWNNDHYEAGVTKLAQQVYLAARLLLETIDVSGASRPHQVSDALGRRLALRSVEGTGPEVFNGLLHTVSGGKIIPFMSDLYLDGWELTETAEALLEAETEAGLLKNIGAEVEPIDSVFD